MEKPKEEESIKTSSEKEESGLNELNGLMYLKKLCEESGIDIKTTRGLKDGHSEMWLNAPRSLVERFLKEKEKKESSLAEGSLKEKKKKRR